MKKLWLDDVRRPPDDSWRWVTTARECIAWLNFEGPFSVVSLDHDLADPGSGDDDTGMAVVRWLTAHPEKRPALVLVHSMNPAGRARMEAEIASWVPGTAHPQED